MACWVTFQGCSSICLAACVTEEGDCEVWESVLGSVRVWSWALTAFVALSVYSWLLKHMQVQLLRSTSMQASQAWGWIYTHQPDRFHCSWGGVWGFVGQGRCKLSQRNFLLLIAVWKVIDGCICVFGAQNDLKQYNYVKNFPLKQSWIFPSFIKTALNQFKSLFFQTRSLLYYLMQLSGISWNTGFFPIENIFLLPSSRSLTALSFLSSSAPCSMWDWVFKQ